MGGHGSDWGKVVTAANLHSGRRRAPALLSFFAGSATAAAPAPDPPPLAVAPEAPQPSPAPASKPPPAPVVQQAPVVTRTVVTPAPVVTRSVATPVVVPQEEPAKPAGTQAKKKPAAKKVAAVKPKPKPKPVETPALPPHDRGPVPLVALIPAVEELDRGLLVLAGAGLAFVALGGAVVLLAARRELEGLVR